MDDLLFVKLMTCLETRLPVNDARLRGAHVWPLVRITLLYMLLRDLTPEQEQAPGHRRIHDLVGSLYDAVAVERTLPGQDLDASDFLPPPAGMSGDGGNVLFFARPEEYHQDADGLYASRLADPWVRRMAGRFRVMTVEHLSQDSLNKQPRRHPVLLLPHTMPACMARMAAEIEDQDLEPATALCAAITAFTRTHCGFDMPGLTAAVHQNLRLLYAHKRQFDAVLAAYRPVAAFFICSYHVPALALSWSCRDNDALSVELQHGVTGDVHPGYTHWTSLPPEGYALRPALFAAWGKTSANNLQRWHPLNGHPHRTVIAGRHDLDDDALVDSAAELSDRHALQALTAWRKPVVLVALGPTARTGLSQLMIQAMARAPRHWLWLVRSHPLASSQSLRDRLPAEDLARIMPEGVAATLAARGVENAECALANRLRLPTLLKYAQSLVTGYSSSALEAFACNVPTTFCDPMATTMWSATIGAGYARYADTPDALVEAVACGWEGMRRPDQVDIIARDSALMNGVLDSLRRPSRT